MIDEDIGQLLGAIKRDDSKAVETAGTASGVMMKGFVLYTHLCILLNFSNLLLFKVEFSTTSVITEVRTFLIYVN